MLQTEIALLDEILAAHATELGGDLVPYRNHAYRVANLCVAFASDNAQLDRIAVAAAFHDLGIWTDDTFDYLQPSVRLAADWLAGTGRGAWTPEITEMILQHHRISRWRGDPGWLVEPFRRADWADVTLGALAFGLPRGRMAELYVAWPSAGFHRRLVELELGQLRRAPLNPLPMLRW